MVQFLDAGQHGTEAILNHVLSPVESQAQDYLRPMMALPQHQIEDSQVLVNSPLPPFDVLVEVVEPVLTTLFGTLKVFSLCFEVEDP